MPVLPETRSFLAYLQSTGACEIGLKRVVTGLFVYAGDDFPILGGNGFPWPMH